MNEIIEHIDKNLVFVDENLSITSAAKLMAEKKVDILIVTKNGDHSGIATSTDFLYKAVAQALDCSKTSVSEITSKPLITINHDGSMKDALHLMVEKNIRGLTVMEDGKPIGILKLKHLASYFFQNSAKPVDPIPKFWSRYDCREGKESFVTLVQDLLNEMKDHLKSDSPTAKAIARDASWEEICKCAEDEEIYELAQILDLSRIG